MNRHSWMVGALALLALAWGAPWVWDPSAASRGRLRRAPDSRRRGGRPWLAAARARPHPRPRLSFAHRGHPIVWLRRGREHPRIRAAPGGKVVKRLGWQTDFGSRTVFAVVSPPGPVGGRADAAPSRRAAGVGEARPVAAAIRLDAATRSTSTSPREPPASRLGRPGGPLLRRHRGVGHLADPHRPVRDHGHVPRQPETAYGCCALATTATQPNLPSGWLGGDRIAIHGTTGRSGRRLSHGCIRAQNADVERAGRPSRARDAGRDSAVGRGR